jgi:hypothetical protein
MSGPFGSTAWMANPASGFYDFEISNSLRFEDGDSALLARTPGSASNRDTWTWSAWVKRGNIGAAKGLFAAPEGASGNTAYLDVIFTAADELAVSSYATLYRKTTRLFRDPSAWYHLVVAVDTTDGTADDRIKIYVNGVQETSFVTNNAKTQNEDTGINSAVVHEIGDGGNHFDGYMAEVNFIDGSQLTPSSFGETKNDIWIPKNTSGLTFGTNGFRLQFKQTGTGTASSTTIGADTSGNDNHWTSTNLVASDVMPDSPTNNFATFNSIHDDTTGASTEVFSEGNLEVGESGTGWSNIFGSQGMPSGKWYWESYMAGSGTVDCLFGIAKSNWYVGSDSGLETAGAYTIYQHSNGNLYSWNNASQTNEGTTVTFTWGDILQVAYDADTGKLWFGKSNTWLFSGDPSAGSTPKMTIGASDIGDMLPAWSQYHAASAWGVNFGQDSSFAGNETAQGNADGNGIGDFYYAPPSGFLALCTANLPDPVAAIDPAQGGSPQDYFNTVLYTGNGGTQSISVGFQPDFTWNKQRSAGDYHALQNSVAGPTKILVSNNTDAERTKTDVVTAFTSTGFTLGADSSGFGNENTHTYASWNWKAGGSGVSNTDGSITSTVSANADTGFSIVSYTGTGSDGSTVGHGLSSAPELAIIKGRDAGYPWMVMGYPTNTSFPNDGSFLTLSTTDAIGNGTGSEISIGSSTMTFVDAGGNICESSRDYIAYCFHSVDGYSKFGTYTGNNNADGPFVYTGFRPAFVMIKDTTVAGNWVMYDSKTDPINFAYRAIFANTSGAESTDSSIGHIDFLSNGFKYRDNSNDSHAGQVSGATPIYMAFAEQSFKYANAR